MSTVENRQFLQRELVEMDHLLSLSSGDPVMAYVLNNRRESLDLAWLKDKSLADLDNLPDPKDLAEEIVENIEARLHHFRTVLAALGK